jgi:hypothetical protein
MMCNGDGPCINGCISQYSGCCLMCGGVNCVAGPNP